MGVYTLRSKAEKYPDRIFYPILPIDSTGPQMSSLPDYWPGTYPHVIVLEKKGDPIGRVLFPEQNVELPTFDSQARYESLNQTGLNTRSGPMILLERVARSGNVETFTVLVQSVDWATRLPDDLALAVTLSLKLELIILAEELAQIGRKIFPNNEKFLQLVDVLSPPTVKAVKQAPIKGLKESNAWIRENADQYRGRWVAILEGKLLGSASSLRELKQTIGEEVDPSQTIITRIL